MSMNMDKHKGFVAALMSLIVLQLCMLGALYAGVAPHPPAVTPIFGMAPFLACAISLAVAALVTGSDSGAGRVLAGAAAIAAGICFGPQKYFDPQFPLIWPAVITGQIAIVTILWELLRQHRPQSAG